MPTWAMPIDHQNQLAAMPLPATIAEMASGVSAAKVVATMEIPTSQPGRLRSATKYDAPLPPAFLDAASPAISAITSALLKRIP